MKNLLHLLLFFWSLFLVDKAVLATTMDGNIPIYLLKNANERGCGVIKEFFNRDGITLPPFIFDYQSKNKEYKFAYVCEKNNNYFLMFSLADSKANCKEREIDLGEEMPGGLGIYSELILLSSFTKNDNSETKSKSKNFSGFTDFYPLMIEYDGTGNIFYCYQGNWLKSFFH